MRVAAISAMSVKVQRTTRRFQTHIRRAPFIAHIFFVCRQQFISNATPAQPMIHTQTINLSMNIIQIAKCKTLDQSNDSRRRRSHKQYMSPTINITHCQTAKFISQLWQFLRDYTTTLSICRFRQICYTRNRNVFIHSSRPTSNSPNN